MARPPFQIGDFVGQMRILRPVLRRQEGAMARGEPMPHHLFIGASGLGKSLAARELAARAGTTMHKFRCTESAQEFVGRLQQMQPGDIGFLDECHRLPSDIQELLYEVIDQHTVPGKMVSGASGTESVKITADTFICGTDQPGRLLNALHKRIPVTVRFQPYPLEEMREIVSRIAARRNLLLSSQAARQMALVCHGIPRRAEHRVNDVRYYFQDSEVRQLGKDDVKQYLESNGIDLDGLGEAERNYLVFLADNGSASLEALASYLGIDPAYVKDQVEQPLRYRGLVIVRSSGRALTEAGQERVRQIARTLETSEGD